ncbi:MAG: hypothetical protein C4292_00770, partial [Nitrososphaera sp.]
GALVGAASLKVMRGGRAPAGAFRAALAVAGAAWFSLYVMPALKYPPSPDTLFDAEVAGQYSMMFAAYAASSGLAALGCAVAFAKTKRKNWYVGAAGAYLAIAAALFFVFPGLPEPPSYPQSLLGAWRSATAAGATAFWFITGILAGAPCWSGPSCRAARAQEGRKSDNDDSSAAEREQRQSPFSARKRHPLTFISAIQSLHL